MNSEKVKEIKDNITICSTKIECKGCTLFPNIKSTNCRNKLLTDALTLINELESENERLKGTAKEFAERLKQEPEIHSPIDGYDFWKI